MVARLLWEQDAAGSNPVSPMRSKTSPQLVFKPSRKGRFFYCSPCSSKLLERASHYAVAPNIKVPTLVQVAEVDNGHIN